MFEFPSEINKTMSSNNLFIQESVVKNALTIFTEKFQNFVKNINKMDVLFSSSFTQLQDVGKAFTRCGLTRCVTI
jgi:DNA topoisomerase-3